MTELTQRVDNALNEARILVLVGQVLFAYTFESVFEKTFARLPESVRLCDLAAMILLIAALALLMSPGPFHCIVEGGQDSEGFHRYTSRVVSLALPLFAAAMALAFYALSYRAAGPRGAAALAALVALSTGVFWEGLALRARRRREREEAR